MPPQKQGDPSSLKVAELREELAKRGLDTKGLKAELVARLTEALAKENGGGDGGDVDVEAELTDASAAAAASQAPPERRKRAPAAVKKDEEAAVSRKRSKRGEPVEEEAKEEEDRAEAKDLATAAAEVSAATKAIELKERMLAAEEQVAREHREEANATAEAPAARAQREALAADAADSEVRSLRNDLDVERRCLTAAEEAEARAMAEIAERAERRAAERAAAAAASAPAPPRPPAAADGEKDDDDEDAPLDANELHHRHDGNGIKSRGVVTGAECPYLDTIDRSALDFDFAAACSVTLATSNVYCCLTCGRSFAGRGKKTPAHTHALDSGHHVFMKIDGGNGSEEQETSPSKGRAWVLPEGYEVDDPCLDPIRAALDPRFDAARISSLDADKKWARSLEGEAFVPGIVGLNSLGGGKTDFAGAVIQCLARVSPLRDFFLRPANYSRSAAASPLVARFGELMRRIWNDRGFRGHVSPHELMVAVERSSNGRFSPGGGGGGGTGGAAAALQRSSSTDAAAFLVWLLNALHVDLVIPPSPTAPKGAAAAKIAASAKSIITACFQGEVEVTTETATVAGGGGGGGGAASTSTTTTKSKFLVLALDPPPAPLYKDALEQNIIPQVALTTLLSKYDGKTVTDDARAGRRTLRVTRLPRFLLLHVRRFTRNAFFAEKNPTIVNFPVKGLPLGDLLRYRPPKHDDPYRYDLAANIAHEGPAAGGVFKAHVHRKADGNWYEARDLTVSETLPQVVALSEAYVQVWEKRPGIALNAGAVPMETTTAG